MEIRSYRASDEKRVVELFRYAYTSPPWNEQWDSVRAVRFWKSATACSGFACLVAVVDGRILAATCYDTPTLEELSRERGRELGLFVTVQHVREDSIVWIRDTVCDPDEQGRGIAKALKKAALASMRTQYQGGIVLTRMRDDNPAIVRLNQRLGFQKTGVRVVSKTFEGLVHDYWFLRL